MSRSAKQVVVDGEKKSREEAVKKSADKAQLVRELLSAQYETSSEYY
jgi:hypothetical protein